MLTNSTITDKLINTAKLDSTTIVHLILLGIIVWLIFFHIPAIMKSHEEDRASHREIMKEMSLTIKEMGKDNQVAWQKIVDRLDIIIARER